MKKSLSVLLAVVMVITTLCALPFSALAEDYDVWVGGTQVTSTNAENVLGDGTISYNAQTKTLILNNANIQTSYETYYGAAAIYTTDNLTVIGYGSVGNSNIDFGIYAEGEKNLTLNGDFTITGSLNGIYSYDNNKLLIKGGSINVTGGTNGIFASVNGDITLNGGNVSATGNGKTNAYGLGIQSEKLTVNGGSLTATGGTNGNPGCGISADSLSINGGRVTAIGNNNALGIAPTLTSNVTALASYNMTSTGAVSYDASQNDSYKWFQSTYAETFDFYAVGDCFSWGFTPGNSEGGLRNNGGGTYSRTFTATKAVPKAMLKVTDGGSQWYGDEFGRNYTFTITGAGEFTVTYYSSTNKVSVSGDVVDEYVLPVSSVTAIGTGKNNFLNDKGWTFSDDNKLSEVTSGVWEIAYDNVGAGNYEFKFALDGGWTSTFGPENTNAIASGIAQKAKYNADGNITFNVYSENSTVKLQLDLSNYSYMSDSGAKFTVTVNGITAKEFTDVSATVSGFKDGGTVGETTVSTTDEGYTVSIVDWFDCDNVFDKNGENVLQATDTFVGDKTYTVGVRFTPEGYNTIAKSVDAIINDKTGKIGGYYGGTAREFFVTVTIPPHVHDYAPLITPATLSENGSIVQKCACGDVQSSEVIYAPKTFTLSKTAYTYDGKAKKPTVTVKDSRGNTIAASNYTVTYASGRKAIGSYAVTVKFKGSKYEGSKKLTFKINPKGTSVSKVSSPKKAQLKATWKKQTTKTTGYQIQVATDSKFTKNIKKVTVSKNKTTSTIIKKLGSKKKYYVRVRTYKTVGKTKYYSAWSKSKTIKVK